MTIPTPINRWDFDGNGTATVFPFTGKIWADSDLVVVKLTADMVQDILDLNIDYTVQTSPPTPGGTVTLTTPLPRDYKLTIKRVLPMTQETDLRNQGAYFAEIHEDVFDRLTVICLQLKEILDRTLKLAETDQAAADLPDVSSRSDRLLAFDHQGNPVAGPATSDVTAIEDAVSAVNAVLLQVAGVYDNFDDRYLGAKSADPTLDNDGAALITGALYWNIGAKVMKAYDGAAWAVAYAPSGDFLPLAGGTMTGVITSEVTTGTAPLVIASTTKVANLNADKVNGQDFAIPGTIGGTTPGAGFFTNITNAALTAGRIIYATTAGLLATTANLLFDGANLTLKGILKIAGATSGFVGLQVPATAGSTTYTLPSADGNSGDALKTNGSGVLSFGPAAGHIFVEPDGGTEVINQTTNGDIDWTDVDISSATGADTAKFALIKLTISFTPTPPPPSE